MIERITTILLAGSGILAGLVAGMAVVFLFSPLWPLTLLMAVALPFGAWTSHRPWQGKRKKGEYRKMAKELFGPPITDNGYALGVGVVVGFGVAVPFFGRMIWGQL